jgi:hypothetical protein
MEVSPFLGAAQKDPGQVGHVQPLHDEDNCSILLIVQPRQQRIKEPLIHSLSFALGHGINGFERIIDDDDVPAASR